MSCVWGREGKRVDVKLPKLHGFSFPTGLYVSLEMTLPNLQKTMLGKPALHIMLFVLQCSVDALKALQRDSYTYTGVFTMKFNQQKVEAREKHQLETVSGAVWETPVCAEQVLGLGKQYRLTGEDCAMHLGLPAWGSCEVGR